MPEMTIQQAFDLAVQHHQAGRLNDAESLYRQSLAVEPRHADSLHNLGLVAHHVGKNDDAVEVFCYAELMNPDAVTARIERLAGHWRKIAGQTDAEVADLIRSDAIDILVDLAGHTANNRLPVFARKPAPLQVTWLGYPKTTGLDTIDYRITDDFADPPESTERLEFKGKQTLEGYLALHHEVDILLDSHPFSGHTVNCHALWMGVSVVTLAGKTHCSRMVASVLRNVGLAELIAAGPEDYVRIAVELANDLPRLAHIRSSLRERMEQSPLMEALTFARDIEAAYREMWRNWCEQPE